MQRRVYRDVQEVNRHEKVKVVLKAAGFQDVTIIAESLFPVQELVHHPAAEGVSGGCDTVTAVAEQLSASIASIKVYAVKP